MPDNDYSEFDALDIVNCCQARISAIQTFCISVSELACNRDLDPRRDTSSLARA